MFVKKYSRSLFFWGAVALISGSVSALAGSMRPIFIAHLISGNNDGGASLNFISSMNPLFEIRPILLLIILEVIDFSALSISGWASANLAARVARVHRIKLALAATNKMARGDVEVQGYLTLSKTHVETIENFVRFSLVASFTAILQILSSLFFAYTIGAWLAILLLFELTTVVIITQKYSHIYRRLATHRFEADAKLIENGGVTLRRGKQIYHGGSGASWLTHRFREFKSLSHARIRMGSAESIFQASIAFVIGIYIVIGYLIIVEYKQAPVSEFLVFFLYASFIIGAVSRIASVVPEAREAMVSVELIRSFSPNQRTRSERGRAYPIILEATFPYTSLHTVSIDAGSRFCLYGQSGSGKTSALESVLGVSNGRFRAFINGEPARDLCENLPSRGVRYLSDTPTFEEGRIIDNCNISADVFIRIAYSYKLFLDKSDEEIRLMVQRIVLQNGEPLSLGERQRIQLLRVISQKPEVLLMDEALSGVPEQQEIEIVNSLINDQSIKVILYVSHRLSVRSLFKNAIHLASN
jgi:ABC-type bacteriocin/lantibiotic exporter with double-glycine peptidase domain